MSIGRIRTNTSVLSLSLSSSDHRRSSFGPRFLSHVPFRTVPIDRHADRTIPREEIQAVQQREFRRVHEGAQYVSERIDETRPPTGHSPCVSRSSPFRDAGIREVTQCGNAAGGSLCQNRGCRYRRHANMSQVSVHVRMSQGIVLSRARWYLVFPFEDEHSVAIDLISR